MRKLCQYESTGQQCFGPAVPDKIFCEAHQYEQRYIGIVCEDEAQAEDYARHIRNNSVKANVYQYRFVIIGPTNQPAHYFQNGGPCFEQFRYEDTLERIIAHAGLIVVPPYILHPVKIACPKCEKPHVDKLEDDGTNWARKPHRKHLCHYCGEVFQPFNYYTIGVAHE